MRSLEEIRVARNEAKRLRYATDSEYRGRCNAHVAISRKRYPDRVRARETAKSRRRCTGWTQAEFDAALMSQGGRCAVCGKPPGRRGLQADHCHTTGKKRALLCVGCNVWIGVYENDPELGEARLQYIKEHK